MNHLSRVIRIKRKAAQDSSFDPEVWNQVGPDLTGTVTPASERMRQINQAIGVTVTHAGLLPYGADVQVDDRLEVLELGDVVGTYVVRTIGEANTRLGLGLEALR